MGDITKEHSDKLISHVKSFFVMEFYDKYSRTGSGPYTNANKKVIYYGDKPDGDVWPGMMDVTSSNRGSHKYRQYIILLTGDEIHIHGKVNAHNITMTVKNLKNYLENFNDKVYRSEWDHKMDNIVQVNSNKMIVEIEAHGPMEFTKVIIG